MLRLSVILLTTVLLISSCASPRPWTKEEKIAAGYFCLSHVADYYTTKQMLDKGHKELNPALGENPSNTELIVYFPLTATIGLSLSHFFPKLRKPLLYGYGSLSFGAAIHNQTLD